MEEKINVKETLKKLKEEQVEKFINYKLSDSEFSDTQKGLVSAWLDEAVNLGFAIGEKHGMAETNTEALEKIIEMFSNTTGLGEIDEHLKRIIYNHRSIVRWLVMTLSNYESLTDELINKSTALKPKMFDCLGITSKS